MKKILQRATQTNYFPIFLCIKNAPNHRNGAEFIIYNQILTNWHSQILLHQYKKGVLPL